MNVPQHLPHSFPCGRLTEPIGPPNGGGTRLHDGLGGTHILPQQRMTVFPTKGAEVGEGGILMLKLFTCSSWLPLRAGNEKLATVRFPLPSPPLE